jgi:zinc transporter, ZIP family
MSGVSLAFALTILAGLATSIGSLLAFSARRTNLRFLSVATGFSAGAMLYVSFMEILVEGGEALRASFGEVRGDWITLGAFFAGIGLIGAVDVLIPAAQNPHEPRSEAEIAPLHDPRAPLPDTPAGATLTSAIAAVDAPATGRAQPRLLRMGLFMAVAMAIHNVPEGLVTFFATLQDPSLGLVVALAIALHNIPEGISVSVPIFYATGSRRKAFAYSSLSGLAEPLGALLAYLLLRSFVGEEILPEVLGILLAGVAGIMVYISLDELLPASRAYGKGHDSLLGLVAGMAVMAVSLLLMP